MKSKSASVQDFIGKTFTSIDRSECELKFRCEDGSYFSMGHRQSCCENVEIEDICGDLADLVGSPIIRAEDPSSLYGFDEKTPEGWCPNDQEQWTFYILGTAKGTLTIRWFGTSNGYYSTDVDIDFYPINTSN